jgi:hypothetical protein
VSPPSLFGSSGASVPPPPPAAPPGSRFGEVPVGQPQWAHPPRPGGTNGLAIAGFVLGLLWLCGLGSLLGVIFGFVALSQIRRSNQSGRGFAIAGIVLGIIGIIATVVAGILIATKADEIINAPEEVDDIEIAGCEVGADGEAQATLLILNDSSKESDYTISVRFRSGGETHTTEVEVTRVAPGAAGSPREVSVSSREQMDDAGLRCDLLFVDRHVSPGGDD